MMLRAASGSAPSSIAWRPEVTPRLPPAGRTASMMASARASSSRRVIEGFSAAASTAVGSTLCSRADRVANQVRQRHDLAPRFRIASFEADRRAERDERARLVADRVPHHLGHLARERTLPPLLGLVRQDVIFEDHVVRDAPSAR